MLTSQGNNFQRNKKTRLLCLFSKKGNNSSVSNYRPNSLLNNIPEVFEFVMTDHISHSFKKKLDPSQLVFFKTKSTTINLVTYLGFISPLLGIQLVRLVLFIVTALHSALFHIIFHSINVLLVDSAVVM